MSEELKAMVKDADGATELQSPGVGRWRNPPQPGDLIRPGVSLGSLEVLGRMVNIVAPRDARGVVDSLPGLGDGYGNLQYGQTLLTLRAMSGEAAEQETKEAKKAGGSNVVRSASSGRFYLRPGPDKPPFCQVGDEVSEGQTIYLLEVMKTFSRVSYGGDELPAKARVVEILVEDGDDLEQGQAVLAIEPLS